MSRTENLPEKLEKEAEKLKIDTFTKYITIY
jgi:hypothetical protein